MLQESLTMLGAFRKNKREIPPSFFKENEVGKTIFRYDNCVTMLPHNPQKKKVLSSIGYAKEVPKILSLLNFIKILKEVHTLMIKLIPLPEQLKMLLHMLF